VLNKIGIRVKEIGRNILGDQVMSSLHALRFYYRNVTGRSLRDDVALQRIGNYVREGEVVVDVGANNANWSYHLSRFVGQAGRVLAFEPHPYYAAVTQKTLGLHRLRNVELFDFGLAEAHKTAQLQHIGDDGRQLSGRSFIVDEPTAAGRTIEIELRPLDSLIDDYPELARVAFIKIDAEGFEYFVVKGAIALLERARPLVLAETGHARLHGIDEDSLFRLLGDQGYQAYGFAADGGLQTIGGFADIRGLASKDALFAPAGWTPTPARGRGEITLR
jgi:FkbM family methyltransferase